MLTFALFALFASARDALAQDARVAPLVQQALGHPYERARAIDALADLGDAGASALIELSRDAERTAWPQGHYAPRTGFLRGALSAWAMSGSVRPEVVERLLAELRFGIDRERSAHFATMAVLLGDAAAAGADLVSSGSARMAVLAIADQRGWEVGVAALADVCALAGDRGALVGLEAIAARLARGASAAAAASSMRRDVLARLERAIAVLADEPGAAATRARTVRAAGHFSEQRDAALPPSFSPWRRALVAALGPGLSAGEAEAWDLLARWDELRVALQPEVRALGASAREDVRVLALVQLELATDRDALRVLRDALRDPSPWVRRQAFAHLGASGEVAAASREALVGDVAHALEDRDAWVRALAAFTLARTGTRGAEALRAVRPRDGDPVAGRWLRWARARAERPETWIVDAVRADYGPLDLDRPALAAAWAALQAPDATKRAEAAVQLARAGAPGRERVQAALDERIDELMDEWKLSLWMRPNARDRYELFALRTAPIVERIAEELPCHPGRSYACAELGEVAARLGRDGLGLHALAFVLANLHGGRVLLPAVDGLGDDRAALAPFVAIGFVQDELLPRRWNCIAHAGGGVGVEAPAATWSNYLRALGPEVASALLRELSRHPHPEVASAAAALARVRE